MGVCRAALSAAARPGRPGAAAARRRPRIDRRPGHEHDRRSDRRFRPPLRREAAARRPAARGRGVPPALGARRPPSGRAAARHPVGRRHGLPVPVTCTWRTSGRSPDGPGRMRRGRAPSAARSRACTTCRPCPYRPSSGITTPTGPIGARNARRRRERLRPDRCPPLTPAGRPAWRRLEAAGTPRGPGRITGSVHTSSMATRGDPSASSNQTRAEKSRSRPVPLLFQGRAVRPAPGGVARRRPTPPARAWSPGAGSE